MALTKEQWFSKIQSWIPSWWFEEGAPHSQSLWLAVAAVFAQIQQDADDQFAETFLLQSDTPILDLLGKERSLTRTLNETNALFASRIQHITSESDSVSIKMIVDGLLAHPGVQMLQAPQDSPYASRSAFVSRTSATLMQIQRNYFLLIIPRQIHVPYTFSARSYFCSRTNFAGSLDSTGAAYDSIIAAVQANKAFGVLWGLIEATS